MDAFWVEATAEETENQFQYHWAPSAAQFNDPLPPTLREDGYDYYLVARNLTFVRYLPAFFPWAGQWGAHNPFRMIKPVTISDLSEIVQVELVVYHGEGQDEWLPFWMQQRLRRRNLAK